MATKVLRFEKYVGWCKNLPMPQSHILKAMSRTYLSIKIISLYDTSCLPLMNNLEVGKKTHTYLKNLKARSNLLPLKY